MKMVKLPIKDGLKGVKHEREVLRFYGFNPERGYKRSEAQKGYFVYTQEDAESHGK